MKIECTTHDDIERLKRLGAPLALEEKGSSSLKKSSFENVEMKVSVMKMCSIGTTIFLLLML